MKLKDLLAPAIVGLVAYLIDALSGGPIGVSILLYATLPGIVDALVAYATYAGLLYALSPRLSLTTYPNELLISLALGFIAYTFIVNYFLSPFRLSSFSLKRYFFSRYSHLKALLGISLIVVWPLAYTRHIIGIVHLERAYDSSISVLLFVYLLTPLHERLSWGAWRKRGKLILPKAEGSLKDAGVELSLEEVENQDHRIVRLRVKSEERGKKQYILSIEAPDVWMPPVMRTRSLGYGEEDSMYLIVKQARQAGKERNLKIYVEDESGKIYEEIPGRSEEPRRYSFYKKERSLSGLFYILLLIVTPLAAIFVPTLFLHLADIRIVTITLLSTLILGYLILKLVEGISSTERHKRVITRLDELAALSAFIALSSFLFGILLRSLKLIFLTMLFSLVVLGVSIISPIFAPERVEIDRELKGKLLKLIPVEPDYYEENLATRAHLLINSKLFRDLYGVEEFRVFFYGDDYISPQYRRVKLEDPVTVIPIRIIPDGFGERELLVRFARLKDEDIIGIDDSDVLIDKNSHPAVYEITYRSVPQGSSGVPREIQQISMKAIAFLVSPTMILNILGRLGLANFTIFLSVFFGTLGALPLVLYLYYKRST